MATRTPGTGGTNQAISLEAGLIADLRLLQSLERDTTRNPNNLNNVTSSTSDDTATFTASITFPINLTVNTDGTAKITAIDYLTTPNGANPHYVVGTGGLIKSSTIQGAIIEQTVLIKGLELNSSKNPNGANYISYTLSNSTVGATGNAFFTASYNGLPLDITQASDGTQSTKGKTYLLD